MRTLLGMALLALAAWPASAQRDSERPRIVLPEPWGPHAVGYRRFDLTDASRRESRGAEPRGPRRVVTQLWYPSRRTGAPPVPYMDSVTARVWGENHRLPAGFQHQVGTHARSNAPVLDTIGRLPVLLFSHGRSWPVQTYQGMLQDLASRGWLVVGMSHPYSENVTVFADGSAARFDQPSWTSASERGTVLTSEVAVLVRDAAFVIATLTRWNADRSHPLFGRIDTAGIGYFGHSLGGAAAAQALARIAAVDAAATIEGSVYDSTARPALVEKPLLSIVGGYNRADLSLRDYLAGRGGVVYEALVRGAWHASFADLLRIHGAYAPKSWHSSHRRELSPDRVNQITTDYLDAFFRRYVLNEPSLLLRPHSEAELGSYTTSGYPEVELRVVLW